MKKTIVVTFADGSKQTMDAAKMENAISSSLIGKPATHEIWLKGLQQIACFGVIDDNATDNYVKYHAPGSIKSVELFFGEYKAAKHIVLPEAADAKTCTTSEQHTGWLRKFKFW